MTIKKRKLFSLLMLLTTILAANACREYDNFTTYYNTYYNADRLMGEAEEEFDYQDEKIRVDPRVITPDPKISFDAPASAGAPPFLQGIIITQQKLQPVQTKLDSVIVKCSKILAKHPKSNYVDKSLYLIAKAYFYRREWLPSQIKCSELLDKFENSDLAPDAYLLMAKDLLIQKKIHAGKIALSRTVDIAWAKKRYDILSETFKVQADLALYENEPDEAMKPYRQAVAQTEDNTMKARWQTDLGLLLYRLSRFDDAAKALLKVHEFNPDYVTEFEAYMYRAQSYTRSGKFPETERIIEKLADDRNNEPWEPWIHVLKMDLARFKKDDSTYYALEKFADSAYASFPAIQTVYFEKGMEFFYKKELGNARRYFARTRTLRTSMYFIADKMYYLLTQWEQKQNYVQKPVKQFLSGEALQDSIRQSVSLALFDLGRVFEQLQMKDSATSRFKLASQIGLDKNPATARYIYAYSRTVQDSFPDLADSLLELLVDKYPRTEYGREAIARQGYTSNYLIDTAADLFRSGKQLMRNKDYPFALSQFDKVYKGFPKSTYAPRAIYTSGWLFEKDLKNVDSALYYYQLLLKLYPASDYAKDVKQSVEFLAAKRAGIAYVDSAEILKQKQDSIAKAKQERLQKEKAQEKEAFKKQRTPNINDKVKGRDNKNAINPMELMKNAPGNLLDDAKKIIKDPPVDVKHNIPTSMEDLLKSDSTKPKTPAPPPKQSTPADTSKPKQNNGQGKETEGNKTGKVEGLPSSANFNNPLLAYAEPKKNCFRA